MEECNDIFLAGGDALVYLTEPMRKKYSTKLVWGHPFSTYIFYDLFFNSPFPVRTCKHLGWPPPSIPPVAYVLNGGLFHNQKTNKIPLSSSLRYKHSKKKYFFKSHTRPKILLFISVTLSHINGMYYNTLQVLFESMLLSFPAAKMWW